MKEEEAAPAQPAEEFCYFILTVVSTSSAANAVWNTNCITGLKHFQEITFPLFTLFKGLVPINHVMIRSLSFASHAELEILN